MKNYLVKGILVCLVFLLTAASPAEKKRILAPNFVLKDLDQIKVELASFKDKKPVVLFFWTTWCPYCQKALKDLNRDQLELSKEGYEILPINSGEPAARVARFAKNNGFTFRIILDTGSEASDAYDVYGVPAYFLVDKKGYLRLTDNYFPREEAKALAKEK
ncbi:MAG: TlpA disulfide reductase family protein [Candidatus Omnitrophica bacterium]|nr:TlpA disulfide reductase family protein [Candidatus Omnitrophota bacterium]